MFPFMSEPFWGWNLSISFYIILMKIHLADRKLFVFFFYYLVSINRLRVVGIGAFISPAKSLIRNATGLLNIWRP